MKGEQGLQLSPCIGTGEGGMVGGWEGGRGGERGVIAGGGTILEVVGGG